MAEKQHIAWLLEGVTAWNARRERELEDVGPDYLPPDFSYMNLWWEFLDAGNSNEDWPISLAGVDLIEADLSHTMLRSVNFDNAGLIATDLTGANLNDTLLTNVYLQMLTSQMHAFESPISLVHTCKMQYYSTPT